MSFYGLLIAVIFLICMLEISTIITESGYLNSIHLAYLQSYEAIKGSLS